MSIDKLPRWSWWAVSAVLLWIAWGFLVGRPLMHRVSSLKGQCGDIESEMGKLDARIATVPNLVLRLNNAKYRLDSTLSSFTTDGNIDELVRGLRVMGGHRGLGDVRVDPELMSLLHVPMAASAPGIANGRLDTVIVNLSAAGAFKTLGQWLEDVEGRSDFRFWTKCHWSSLNDAGLVGLDAQGALVVVNEPDSTIDLITMEAPQ